MIPRMTAEEAITRYHKDECFQEHVNALAFMRTMFTLSELGSMLSLAEALHQQALAEKKQLEDAKHVLVDCHGEKIPSSK